MLTTNQTIAITTNQIIAITGVATLLATAVAIFITLKGVRDELWLQTFSEYTRRYLDYVRELPSVARDPNSDFTLAALYEPERERMLNAARMYVNLCSEEHYLHSKRRIDHTTWGIWAQGMRDAFLAPWFCEAWEKIRHEYRLYPSFCDFFESCHDQERQRRAETKGAAAAPPN